MEKKDIDFLMTELEMVTKDFALPSVSFLKVHNASPFLILVSTIISLRTKDEITLKSSNRLFECAKTPKDMIEAGEDKISELIYPAGFYRTKASKIVQIAKDLIEKYDGKVPDTREKLLELNGVGRKTANLVLAVGFEKKAICVDTHVHRISNRLGLVKTKDPYGTELALEKILPKKYWLRYNDLMVAFGQNICRPIGPKCEVCPLKVKCHYYKISKI